MVASTVNAGVGPFSAIQEGIRILAPLREWETRTFPDIHLSRADLEIYNRIGETLEPRLGIDELRNGLRVRATSWVGLVRLETIEIRVVPKLAGGQLGLARLLEFTSGIEGLSRFQIDATVRVVGDSLFDLVALLLAQATERVVRHGLLADYSEREEALGAVRGRILADRQILLRFGQLDRIVCRYDEFDHDTNENRLLVIALRAALHRVLSRSVHRRLSRLLAVLGRICDPGGVDLRNLRCEITYNRTNVHYKQAHALAWLVLDGLGVDDLLAHGSTRSFTFLLDMNLLFERFVGRLVERQLERRLYRVDYQTAYASIIWDATADRSYSRIIPDLVVSQRGNAKNRLAIDAKYKLYDGRPVATSDIYQTFFYAYALSSRPAGSNQTALVLYPAATSECKSTRLEIRPLGYQQSAAIIALGIPIPEALREVKLNERGRVETTLQAAITHSLGVKGYQEHGLDALDQG